jgi:hypothetical protein
MDEPSCRANQLIDWLPRLSLLRWLADGGDVLAGVSLFLRVRLSQNIFSVLKD